jgi:hypothetical protein
MSLLTTIGAVMMMMWQLSVSFTLSCTHTHTPHTLSHSPHTLKHTLAAHNDRRRHDDEGLAALGKLTHTLHTLSLTLCNTHSTQLSHTLHTLHAL